MWMESKASRYHELMDRINLILVFSLSLFTGLFAQNHRSDRDRAFNPYKHLVIPPSPASAPKRSTLQNSPAPPQMPNFPKQMAGPPNQVFANSSCRLADLDGDGDMELIAGSVFGPDYFYGALHVWEHTGASYPGWSAQGNTYGYGYAFYPTAAIGDIEGVGVGNKDIVIGSLNFLWRLDKNGNQVNGWEFPDNYHYANDYLSPVLFDLNGDGQLEIISASVTSIWIYKADGSTFPGWPQDVSTTQFPNGVVTGLAVAVGDLEGNGSSAEIVVAAQNNTYNAVYLYAWRSNGTPLAGWPIQVLGFDPAAGYNDLATPTLADFGPKWRPRNFV